MPSAPRDRNGFQVAIFCALPLEAENVLSVFDICWEDQDIQYGKAAGDLNSYNTGVIGDYNVVLVHMPSMGGNSATLAAAGLRASFRAIQLALVVGICGVVPKHPKTDLEIILGDVVISTAVVQYDFGRQYPGRFQRKGEVEDSLSRANPEIRAFMNKLTTRQNRERFNKKLQQLVQSEQFRTEGTAAYPGAVQDRLYEASYIHGHQADMTCDKCLIDVGTCSRSCDELKCKDSMLVKRDRHAPEVDKKDGSHIPRVHLGRFGSANMVMKSGSDRDRISAHDEVTAFEMEGAGVWEQYPTIVIKAACDYADSHKTKKWHGYAAAMAAACTKVFLTQWIISEPLQDREPFPEPVWHVPFDSSPKFIGRKDELQRLEDELLDSNSRRIVSLLGLGGAGKSRLAIEFAYRMKSKYPVFWVQASSQLTLENDLREIGRKLGIQGITDDKADIKTLVQQRLNSPSMDKWLFVLDNADDEALWGRRSNLEQPESSLVDYLPRTTNGSILITTRTRRVATFLAEKEVIELGAIQQDDAADLFISKLENPGLAADRICLLDLVDKLARLPLAIVQAASYVNMSGILIQTYLSLLDEPESEILKLLSKDFGDASRYPDAINPVAMTWLVSFEHIEKNNALAAKILSAIACLHEKSIPSSLLPDIESRVDRGEAISFLIGYSFVTRQSRDASVVDGEDLYDVHRLVHLAARGWLRETKRYSECVQACLIHLDHRFPLVHHEHRSIWTRYLPHAQRLCADIDGIDLPERYNILRRVGHCFLRDGHYDEAVKVQSMVVTWRENNLGLSDRRLFDAFDSLGQALQEKGEWLRAESSLRKALDWRKEVLGIEHTDTLISMGSLATTYRNQGRYKQAEELQVEVLEIRKRVLGEEHPNTLISMNNLALTYWDQGRYRQAEELQVEELEISKRVLGEEHPNTLTSISNLATTYRNQGRYRQAEELQVEELEIRKKVLGEEHPNTLTSMNNLATTYWNQGRYRQAEELEVEVLELNKKVLGEEHPDTLISINNLATTYWNQGRYRQAQELEVEVLEIRKRVLGEEHPNTLTSMNNLATTYWNQGRYRQAEELQVEVLEISKRVLGEEHPDTLISISNLAATYLDQGLYEQAEELEIEVLEIRKRVLGAEHPDALTSMNNLAYTFMKQQRKSEAVALMSECVELKVRVLGSEHPHTQSSKNRLRVWKGDGAMEERVEQEIGHIPGAWVD